MKRNMDLCRQILFKIEAGKEPDEHHLLHAVLEEEVVLESLDDFAYNLELLVEAGFVRGRNYGALKGRAWSELSLTWKGHEFLDTIRDPEIWRRTKEGARKVGMSGIEFMWELAKHVGKEVVKEKLGITL